jgi:transposase
MPRYKPSEQNGLLLPVILSEQIQPGSFEFALDHLIEQELDLSDLDTKFNNDETGASAYNPRAMLKIVLLAYSRGLTSSRRIAQACEHNIQFIALSGDARPSYTHIAKFVRELGPQIQELFSQVLITCDRMQLIGRQMFAIDGVKLPANASKERSGTHEELRHRADRLDNAAAKIIELHQSQDESGGETDLNTQRQERIEALRREARRTREFVATSAKRVNGKGQELKSNITDPDSAKMATSKGVIQGYAAQAAVDSEHQIIVAADVIGSGSEQSMLLPMVQQCEAYRAPDTLITADAGYHSEGNMAALKERAIPAMIADNQMRQRDERFEGQSKHKAKDDPLYNKQATGQGKVIKLFKAEDFNFIDEYTAICPAGKELASNGSIYNVQRGYRMQQYKALKSDCKACLLRSQCMKSPDQTEVKTVARFHTRIRDENDPAELMRQAIDSARGRQLYSQRIGTVEPAFGNIRHNKRLNRFTLRGQAKVSTQWKLFCLVHNIEKLAGARYGT